MKSVFRFKAFQDMVRSLLPDMKVVYGDFLREFQVLEVDGVERRVFHEARISLYRPFFLELYSFFKHGKGHSRKSPVISTSRVLWTSDPPEMTDRFFRMSRCVEMDVTLFQKLVRTAAARSGMSNTCRFDAPRNPFAGRSWDWWVEVFMCEAEFFQDEEVYLYMMAPVGVRSGRDLRREVPTAAVWTFDPPTAAERRFHVYRRHRSVSGNLLDAIEGMNMPISGMPLPERPIVVG